MRLISESNLGPIVPRLRYHCGGLPRGSDERDVSRCAGIGFASTWAHASVRRCHSCCTCRKCGGTFYGRDGGGEKQDGLAYGIAVGSSLQIALLVAPVLVFSNYLFGTPLDLIFTPFEVAAVTISVLSVGFVAMDGESNWMEGVMLVGVYLMLAIAFLFLPA